MLVYVGGEKAMSYRFQTVYYSLKYLLKEAGKVTDMHF